MAGVWDGCGDVGSDTPSPDTQVTKVRILRPSDVNCHLRAELSARLGTGVEWGLVAAGWASGVA